MMYLTINVLYKRLRFSHKVGVAMIYLAINVLYKHAGYHIEQP